MATGKKKNKKSSFGKMNIWGVFAVLFLFIDLGFIAYRGYMLLDMRGQEKVLEQTKQELIDKNTTFALESDDVGIKKFNAAKYVALNAESTDWKGRTEYLIELYNTLMKLDQQDNTISLQGYAISNENISIEGEVISLQTLYREGGLLDKVKELDFMKSITIPSYALGEDDDGSGGYGFILNADIFQYEG